MNAPWKRIRTLVEAFRHNPSLFLTLINRDGDIISVNSTMEKTLNLGCPGNVNFRDIIHPLHVSVFNDALDCAQKNFHPCLLELYLKNGYYHPMKWQVNAIEASEQNNLFLCIGEKILDDDRLQKFNRLGEKNYQLIMDGLDSGVIFHDEKGEIIAANNRAAEIFEVTLERLYQLRDIERFWDWHWNITDEEGKKVFFQDTPFMRTLREERPNEQVLVIRLLSGEHRWVSYRCKPLFDDDHSKVYAVLSSIEDITFEKNLTSQLRERDAVFNAFMLQTPNLAWMVDEDARLLFGNRAFFDFFNLDAEGALYRPIGDLIPAEVADAMYGRHLQVLQTGQPLQMVETARRADGSTLTYHINLFPVEGISGRKLLGGHAVNLAEKYAVEKQLRETNERLLLLSRATNDAIWEWDMQSGQIFRNDALMDMIGYQFDDPKGLSWWFRRIHPDDRNRVSDIVKESTDQGRQSWQDEYRFKCADGQYKFMRDRGFIVYENGLPVKMIGSLQDITGIRQLENKLHEEKLRQQKEISETVIKVQEKERTRIGHELHDNVNQILSTSKLFIDLFEPQGEEQERLKAKGLEYIVLAIEEIRKLSKELVVPQLRDRGLVRNVQTMIDDIHLSGKLKIRFTHDDDLEFLSAGKKITLFRIIQEQVKNIINHSQAGEAGINLLVRGNEIHLHIEDNGVGFDSQRTSRGIGLSNIHERTRFYGGRVELYTAPGKGCRMVVAIPL